MPNNDQALRDHLLELLKGGHTKLALRPAGVLMRVPKDTK